MTLVAPASFTAEHASAQSSAAHVGVLKEDPAGEGWFVQSDEDRIWVTRFQGIPFVAAIFQARKVLRERGLDAQFISVPRGEIAF